MRENLEIRESRIIPTMYRIKAQDEGFRRDLIADMLRNVLREVPGSIANRADEFVRQYEPPFGRGDLVVEVAACIVPRGEMQYLRGREQEFEREKLRANDAIRKLQDLKARRREMRRRGRR